MTGAKGVADALIRSLLKSSEAHLQVKCQRCPRAREELCAAGFGEDRHLSPCGLSRWAGPRRGGEVDKVSGQALGRAAPAQGTSLVA